MAVAAAPLLDVESRQWLLDLRADGAAAEEAVARLHALLLRAARFEVRRRSPSLRDARCSDEVAREAAADALKSVRAHLDDYRGDGRFTTWAYKFVLLETAVRLRRRSWQGRALPTASAAMHRISDAELEPMASLERPELVRALREGITGLTERQREVLLALAVNGVPIDVLAERLRTTRGALYETLHDARAQLRRHLSTVGLGEPTARPGR